MADQEAQKPTQKIQIDDRGVNVESSDYWLITGTPEEAVFRFGNTKHNVGGPVKITNKVGISYYTAKRLLAALAQTIKRYEEALGAINTGTS
ncbi:MAG: hypothetical protein A2V65_07155 [Deltaproteobacteria bacterium RBG_13_49_15]|nr:MAG: hypothetical protein A2V65_07155 [Deltaproteobacteria bacterium RBG_13_49_15]